MNPSTSSAAAGQRARTQGLARLSAVTVGVGAASVLGAFGIAVTLHNSTAATSANATTKGATTSGTTTDDGASTTTDDGSSLQLQSSPAAPTNPSGPPVATSGGS